MRIWLAPPSDLRLRSAESYWHDILRLFLILQVVMGHMAAIALPSIPIMYTNLAENSIKIAFRLIWRFGSESAFLFIFLSGFMVAGPLFCGITQKSIPSARDFFGTRMKRIVPIAILAILMTAALDFSAAQFPGAADFYRKSYAYDMIAAFSWKNFLGNLLFLQPIAVDSFGSNGPLWTLGYIVQYYALGWVFCAICARNRVAATIYLTLLCILMAYIRMEWMILFISWLIGGVARILRTSSQNSWSFLWVGICIFVFSNLGTAEFSAAASIPVGILLTLGIRNIRNTKPHFLITNKPRMLANESYTVYATHHPILIFIFALGFGRYGVSSVNFIYYILTSILGILAATFALRALLPHIIRRL